MGMAIGWAFSIYSQTAIRPHRYSVFDRLVSSLLSLHTLLMWVAARGALVSNLPDEPDYKTEIRPSSIGPCPPPRTYWTLCRGAAAAHAFAFWIFRSGFAPSHACQLVSSAPDVPPKRHAARTASALVGRANEPNTLCCPYVLLSCVRPRRALTQVFTTL